MNPMGSQEQKPLRVLVVDDEPFMLQAWRKILEVHGCELETLSEPLHALAAIERFRPDVAVLDIRMPGMSGLDLLREVKQRDLPVEVVMMTAYATVETAVEAVKAGAYDYLTKPFVNIEAAALTVLKAGQHRRLVQRNRELENLVDVRDSFEGLVGSSVGMKRVFEMIEAVAYSSSTILIQGESGTGKELVARAIHHRSQRRERPFVAVNCSALTETLLESELFGHERGAFTGATATKKGLFEVADGGSIFLDEVGEVPLPTQVKLLRVLQEGEIKRVGASENRRVDVRVIAATNADLAAARSRGLFREDLYYRLNVITIHLPPLRERPEDIPLLATHFLRKYNARTGKSLQGFRPEAMERLEVHAWPGNVRELENVIERAVVLGRNSDIGVGDLPEALRQARAPQRPMGRSLAGLSYRKAKSIAVAEFDRRYLKELLAATGGNISRAAQQAAMDRSNFRRILKKAGLDNGAAFNGEEERA
jgi:two-component system response regulator HydG